jgi:hypothetical protein
MKPMLVAGILLMVFGAIILAYPAISYTKKEKVIDIGPIEATAEREKSIPLPPILGGVAIVGGGLLLLAGARKS